MMGMSKIGLDQGWKKGRALRPWHSTRPGIAGWHSTG
jgi:hypothetical protein